MDQYNRDTLQAFTIDDLPDLDTAALGALELLASTELPHLFQPYTHPLVVGSAGAGITARVLFHGADALFATESDYQDILDRIASIDGVVLVSASGEKHAPLIAQYAQRREKPLTLYTTNESAPAREFATVTELFPKNREPYTYNTSTYLGMILAHTGERAESIHEFITTQVASRIDSLEKHQSYCLIVPPEYAELKELFEIKFHELFGARVYGRVFTTEEIKHAKTIVPSDELFVSFGHENTTWGQEDQRITIPLPDDAQFGALMAIGYYVIGRIQKLHEPYFKKHIVAYTKEVSKIFGHEVHPIVE